MSSNRGSAYGAGGEVIGMALGNTILTGAAQGGTVIWTRGSEVYSVVSVPASVVKGTAFEITINANAQTEYVLTYAVNGSTESGVARTITGITDQSDGTRNISFSLSFGTAGKRTLRIYGASQQSNAANYRSLNYVEVDITVQ